MKRKNKLSEIRDNGEQMDIPTSKVRGLKKNNLIYYCPPCKCYHLYDGITFSNIDAKIK